MVAKKKVRKEKTREYLENLLDDAGVTDKVLAKSIMSGMESENSLERAKALELAAKWKGFGDVDKRAGEDICHLPIGDISADDILNLTSRCALCVHGKFEPIKTALQYEPESKKIVGVVAPEDISNMDVDDIMSSPVITK